MDSLHTLMNAYQSTPTEGLAQSIAVQDTVVYTFYSSMIEALKTEISSDSILLDEIESLLNSCSPTRTNHVNEKKMYELLLENQRNPDVPLTSAELDEVRALAAGCPDLDGMGVFVARTILPMEEQIAHDDEDCGGTQERIAQSAESEPAFQVALYPNPASTVVYLKSKHTLKHYQLFDTEGRMIQSDKLTTPAIDIARLVPGTYILRVVDDSGRTTEHTWLKR